MKAGHAFEQVPPEELKVQSNDRVRLLKLPSSVMMESSRHSIENKGRNELANRGIGQDDTVARCCPG